MNGDVACSCQSILKFTDNSVEVIDARRGCRRFGASSFSRRWSCALIAISTSARRLLKSATSERRALIFSLILLSSTLSESDRFYIAWCMNMASLLELLESSYLSVSDGTGAALELVASGSEGVVGREFFFIKIYTYTKSCRKPPLLDQF